ncbi:UvrD-helicase domain-containing protein [Sporosarcina sp. P29]|uniref:UvrD-helicase domain-containing protein n=1 Tax=Sporosarcina sp. P29 TaxID=2048252 RepID=UPI00130443F4|nr:UvrD-helicase domain-containing protein [Sporosarcina sp. P29]
MSKSIIISEEDIDWVEKLMGQDIVFDSERRNIIKNLESRDIQAFPGSGKTTVLVAKLAILASKWDSSSSGICVLSHTNVAREEIEKRLGNTSIGAKLLRYPHFIGTVHSFFTTYVALPWLKSNGKTIEIIDTEFTTIYRWNKIYSYYKDILEKKHITAADCCYKKANGVLELSNYKPDHKPYKHVKDIIDSSQRNGYFTFNEILFFAKEALEDVSEISQIVSQRFPLLFIDEAQDTNDFQFDLIGKCFINSVQQGFGDENQAIYNYSGESNSARFPRVSPLVIQQSKRFSNRIAHLANPLAITKSKMLGVNNEFNNSKHSVFIFHENKIADVLNEYGKLILETFSDEQLERYQHDGCYAVGLIHNKKAETEDKHIPKGVYDYWPAYQSKTIDKGYAPKYLIDYFRIGHEELNSNKDTFKQIDLILTGIREFINDKKGKTFIRKRENLMTSFSECLENLEDVRKFREYVCVLQISEFNTERHWNHTLKYVNLLLIQFDINISDSDFVKWKEPENSFNKIMNKQLSNTINFKEKDRNVLINLNSIHGVKGKTHLSTLVLETFKRSHRLKDILTYLQGDDSRKRLTLTKEDNLKCHYVAMTRPRGLLCLAIPYEKISAAEIKKLEVMGWNIIFI